MQDGPAATGTPPPASPGLDEGVKNATINRSLEVVHTVLNRAARVWRDEKRKPWLPAPPLIEMLEQGPGAGAGANPRPAPHPFGQRLRAAGVSEEDRALLLGHALEGMPQHYATATVARLVEAANRVSGTRDRTTLLRVANG